MYWIIFCLGGEREFSKWSFLFNEVVEIKKGIIFGGILYEAWHECYPWLAKKHIANGADYLEKQCFLAENLLYPK